jgi:hypothetical protein
MLHPVPNMTIIDNIDIGIKLAELIPIITHCLSIGQNYPSGSKKICSIPLERIKK